MEPCSSFEEHHFLNDGLCRNCGRADGSHGSGSRSRGLEGVPSSDKGKRSMDVEHGQLPIVDRMDGTERDWIKTPANSSEKRVDLLTNSPDVYTGINDRSSPLMASTLSDFYGADDGQFSLVYDKYDKKEAEARNSGILDRCSPLMASMMSDFSGADDGQFTLTYDKNEEDKAHDICTPQEIADSQAPPTRFGLSSDELNADDGEFNLVYENKPAPKGLRITNLLDNTTEIINVASASSKFNAREPEMNTANTSRQATTPNTISPQATTDLTEIVAAKDLEIETLKKQNEELREKTNNPHMGFRRISGKVIIVGCAAVGKTSLVNRFIHDHFGDTCPTISCDSFSKGVRVDDAVVSLLIYDTAGQERFAGLTTQYFRLGDVCLICCDLSAEDCINTGRVEWWRQEVKGQNPHCCVVLVGTKEDLAIEDEKRRASEYAAKISVPFFPTSAKSSMLGGLFYHVAECCMRRHAEKGIEEARLRLNRQKPGRQEACC